MRERVHLVGGPGDGMTVEVPNGQASVRVVLVTRQDRSWAQVDEAPRGMLQGEVVAVGAYSRTGWQQDGVAVFRFRGN